MARSVKRRKSERCNIQRPVQASNDFKSQPVSIADFKLFFLAKAYDVISEGRFRRHMMHCREIGDGWATNAQRCITEIGARIRHMHERIKELESAPCPPVRRVCEMVIAMPLPPNLKEVVSGQCVISKIKSGHNIVIQKKKHDSERMIVNHHFAHFFIMLWLASKIEYICRNYTRWWLEKQDEGMDINQLCNAFSREDLMIERFCVAFNHAISHICCSVDKHLQHSLINTVTNL